MAVVWPVPFETGPLTTRVALSSPSGYPNVLISWSCAEKNNGVSRRYSLLGHNRRMNPDPDELRALFKRSVTVLAGSGETHPASFSL